MVAGDGYTYGPWIDGGSWQGTGAAQQVSGTYYENATSQHTELNDGPNDQTTMNTLVNRYRKMADGIDGSWTSSQGYSNNQPFQCYVEMDAYLYNTRYGGGSGVQVDGPYRSESGFYCARGNGEGDAFNKFITMIQNNMPAGAVGYVLENGASQYNTGPSGHSMVSVDHLSLSIPLAYTINNAYPNVTMHVRTFSMPYNDNTFATQYSRGQGTLRDDRQVVLANVQSQPQATPITFDAVPGEFDSTTGGMIVYPVADEQSPDWSTTWAAGQMLARLTMANPYQNWPQATYTFTAPRYRYYYPSPVDPVLGPASVPGWGVSVL